MTHIWKKLETPILCLAPMEGATDSVFRQIVGMCGKPDLMFTEFANVDGLYSAGRAYVEHRLQFLPAEKPLIAQIWGSKPEHFYMATKELIAMGFDGVDINMGCPDKNVVKAGMCSALVENRALAQAMILETKRAADGKIPVSVKIRLGLKEKMTAEWSRFLLSLGIDALIVHGRTTTEMSRVPADWSEIALVVRVRDELGVDTQIIGNGDVTSLAEAHQKVSDFGVDGVMVGRGIFQDPWLFHPEESFESKSQEEKLSLLWEHVRLFDETWGERKNFEILKRFFKVYCRDFPEAAQLRATLMETHSMAEVKACLVAFGHTIERTPLSVGERVMVS